jgi:DNA-binding CsgD family transcriptional regulator
VISCWSGRYVASATMSALRGRRNECHALDRLLTQVRQGQSQVLVVRGEAGVGKSALLEYIAEGATGCRVLRAAGVEYEIELAYAGLHQLYGPILDLRERLPQPQREALETAFGLRANPSPDRFIVDLAILGLLSEAAEERPLVCVVDDAQWLDRASALTLAFVARRLLAESVALVFAVRHHSGANELDGLPDLPLGGLGDSDARALLNSVWPGRLDEAVLTRLVAEARGNPLALLEFPRAITAGEPASGFGRPEVTTPLANRIEQSFVRRFASLSDDTRMLLLTAAAEPLGDAALLWRAADGLGLGPDAAEPAQAAGLIDFGALVRFRHPLVRSAIYQAASIPAQREVHLALAKATDPEVDPDRRAWHRALAASGLDERLAAELEHSAGRAQARGGAAAAAAFLARAAELTPDPKERGRRALAAAHAKFDAGGADAALELLATAELAPLGELERARLERLHAEIAFQRTRGNEAPGLLLDAARRLEPLDAAMARETHLEAMTATMFAGRLGRTPDAREIAAAAQAAPAAPQPPRALDLLLDGLATSFAEGYAAGVPPLRKALDALCHQDGLTGADVRWFMLASRLALDLRDEELWEVLATRGVRLARDTGTLLLLPGMANFLAAFNVHTGAFGNAVVLIDEIDAITQATDIPPLKYAAGLLAAWRGDTEVLEAIADNDMTSVAARGEGLSVALHLSTTALLHNGYGRYGDAFAAAQQACEYEDVVAYGLALVELVEAGARIGRSDVAAAALDHLCERTQASGTDWALGVQAGSRALLTDGEDAEALYREAVERLSRSRGVVHLARARLVYGEWLRRENRRVDAREQLRTAHGMFSDIGAEGFAERARHELVATGETARRRTEDTRGVLTPQEAHIAQLARDGLSNPEIGAQLFISPRTVQYHLRKVFQKLNITSRNQLVRLPSSQLQSA